MDAGSENPRGVHAIMVLNGKKDFTLQGCSTRRSTLHAGVRRPSPPLRDFDAAPDSLTRQKVAEAVGILKAWDKRWAIPSVATSVATFYADEVRTKQDRKLEALAIAMDTLQSAWQLEDAVGRDQPLPAHQLRIVHPFDDTKPSDRWRSRRRAGSLASFGAARASTKKWLERAATASSRSWSSGRTAYRRAR